MQSFLVLPVTLLAILSHRSWWPGKRGETHHRGGVGEAQHRQGRKIHTAPLELRRTNFGKEAGYTFSARVSCDNCSCVHGVATHAALPPLPLPPPPAAAAVAVLLFSTLALVCTTRTASAPPSAMAVAFRIHSFTSRLQTGEEETEGDGRAGIRHSARPPPSLPPSLSPPYPQHTHTHTHTRQTHLQKQR